MLGAESSATTTCCREPTLVLRNNHVARPSRRRAPPALHAWFSDSGGVVHRAEGEARAAHAANSNHMHTTTHSRPHMPPPQTTARHHGPAYCKGIMRRHTIMPHPHCRRVWVAWRASWAVISSSTRRPGSMYTVHALHVHHTCSALTLRTHARTAPHRPQCDAATDLPQDVVLNACLIGGVAAGG